MNSFPLRDSQLFGTFAAVGVCLGGAAAYAHLRRRPSPGRGRAQAQGLSCVQQGRITMTPP